MITLKFLLALAILLTMTSSVSARAVTTMASLEATEEVVAVMSLVRQPAAQVFAPEGGSLSLAFRVQVSGAARWRGEMTVTEVGTNGRRVEVVTCRENDGKPRAIVCEPRLGRRREFLLTGRDAFVEVRVKERAERSDTGTAYEIAVDGRRVAQTALYVINDDHVDVAEQNEAVVRWYFRMLALLFLVMFVIAMAAYHAIKRAQRKERMDQLMSQQQQQMARRPAEDGKGLPSYVELFSVARNQNQNQPSMV